MKLEDALYDIELAKKIKELNVKQESIFYHFSGHDGGHVGIDETKDYDKKWYNVYSAFTFDEIIKMLPPMIYGEKLNYELQISKNGLSEFYWCGYYDSQDNMLLGARSSELPLS